MKPFAVAIAATLGLGSAAIAQAPEAKKAPAAPAPIDRSILHVQVILDKLGFGPGVLDGRGGISLVSALKGFQEARGLGITGKIDQPTLRALYPYRAARPTLTLTLDAASLRGPYIQSIPKDYAEQSKLDGMAYVRPIEKLAEMFHTTPAVIAALNPPGMRLAVGQKIVLPNALPSSRAYPSDATPEWRRTLAHLNVEANVPQAAKIVVDKSDKVVRAFDGNGRLVAQYSATIGSASDPLPLGNWKVLHVSPNPDWKMNPKILKGVSDSKEAQIIPPGPNNPVGVVWIDLSREHYGIHGTPDPEKIGRTESNGCVRLTNWDAARVALMVKSGMPVIFQA
ncbi:L,D-transpeptidase family protein [Sphingomonas radiodurans]|uniref:L,D-transpeptidase family protein n=1 Tax=Sphingomonas radiodurans TaxID=2890321 RepID=UPI001E2AFF8A|nr:L,D-transpeptidase family protein [Sphingomonas radiodurans]WBH16531.1 L,D-transpeptidase family protein [Sphingomonas radiodurans]